MSEQDNNPNESTSSENTFLHFPPKPVLIEKKQNAALRSLISLGIYALLFYFLFDRNIVYIAAILLVIIVHEMGHFLFMKLFNYSNVKIFIVPLLGAFTSGKKQEVSQKQLTLIILAGPVPGIFIGCVLYWYNKDWQSDTIQMLYRTFLAINLLNCLPFHPLDGGRLIETLFFKENFVIRLAFGILSIVALLFLFLFVFSPILLVVPVLIALQLYNENKNQKIRVYLQQEKINYKNDYESISDKDYWLIRDCLLFSFPKKYGSLKPGVHEYSVLEPALIQHVSAVLQVDLKSDVKVWQKIALIVFYVMLFILPLVLYLLRD